MIELLRSVPQDVTPMEVLRTAVSALSCYDPDESDNSHDANVRKSFRLTSQIADDCRHLRPHPQGQANRRGRPRRSRHAGNFLWMLNGEKPSETATKHPGRRANPARRP